MKLIYCDSNICLSHNERRAMVHVYEIIKIFSLRKKKTFPYHNKNI